MKLHYPSDQWCNILQAQHFGSERVVNIQQVVYDTRRILSGHNTAFFALKGVRDGHDFLLQAYESGVRVFVVSQLPKLQNFPDATFFLTDDSLDALQRLAKHHRSQFKYPVLAITGSAGKTTVKEWIYHCLADRLRIIRSPKSYNSQLGVALSLLEMSEDYDLAVIEAGISQPGEMLALVEMIQPDYGILSSIGSAHAANFPSSDVQLDEKMILFKNCKQVFIQEQVKEVHANHTLVRVADFEKEMHVAPFKDQASRQNLSLVLAFAQYIGIETKDLEKHIKNLPRLALRMENFEGLDGITVINDTYNADLDALIQSLEYQKSIAGNRPCSAVIGVEGLSDIEQHKLRDNIAGFGLKHVIWLRNGEALDPHLLRNQVVLLKGSRNSKMERIVPLFKLKKHQTQIEISLPALRHNIQYWRSLLPTNCDLLVMVKASSYGSGAEKIAALLQQSGVGYLGVAYVDEGVELRKSGITLPILVMNVDEAGFGDLIRYQLEPAIYSFHLLDQFTRTLIENNITHFPIHLKFDTGMRRLGFEPEEVKRVLDFMQSQPELRLKSVYSHLADSDNLEDKSYSLEQIKRFQKIIEITEQRLSYPVLKHILNTEGIAQFPEAQYDLVRLGIGLYGISVNPEVKKHLLPAIGWYAIVSQIRIIKAGESVGYGRSYTANSAQKIAVIPVGYADGFRRSLSNGKGAIYIHGHKCAVLGRVCMDMIMVDVHELDVKEGDRVEIIGPNQTIEDLAKAMDTIPYEVLTSLSKRMERVYLED